MIQDPAAMELVLQALPCLPPLTQHDCNTLRMLGSLQQISCASVHEIQYQTDLSHAQYAHRQRMCAALMARAACITDNAPCLQGCCGLWLPCKFMTNSSLSYICPVGMHS